MDKRGKLMHREGQIAFEVDFLCGNKEQKFPQFILGFDDHFGSLIP
jgi:hypothetical protein